eukprot:tig00001376_g8532.t1
MVGFAFSLGLPSHAVLQPLRGTRACVDVPLPPQLPHVQARQPATARLPSVAPRWRGSEFAVGRFSSGLSFAARRGAVSVRRFETCRAEHNEAQDQPRELQLRSVAAPAFLLAAAPALLGALSQEPSAVHLAALGESLQVQLYELERVATQLTSVQLDNLSPLSLAVIFGAGLLTSFSPCTLSMLPICVAYIGSDAESDRLGAFVQSVWFSLGIATTLTGLGLAAGGLGLVYGQVGDGLPVAVSILSVVMGLNLLDVLRFNIPSLGDKLGPVPTTLPKSVPRRRPPRPAPPDAPQHPVLAAILGFVSTSGELLQVRAVSGWITPASGAVLLFFGVSSLVSRIAPLLS